MPRFKRMLATDALPGLLAALALAVPAQAEKNTGACVFTGEAKMTDKEEPSRGLLISGGKGSFGYDSLVVTCVGFSKGAPDVSVMDATASGDYVSLICGHGKVWGTVTSLAGPVKYQNLIVGKEFAIHFLGSWPTASTGVFFWYKTKGPKLPVDLKADVLEEVTNFDENKPRDPDDWHWHPAGTVRLDLGLEKEPSGPNLATGDCTKATTVTGTIIVTES